MIFNNIINSADIIQTWNETIELRLITFVVACILLLYITDLLCRKAIVPLANRITRRTSSRWDDILLNSEVLTNISRIFPPIIMLALLPHMLEQDAVVHFWSAKVIKIYITAISIKLSFSVLNAFYDLSIQNQKLRNRTLKGVFQMFKIIAICVGE